VCVCDGAQDTHVAVNIYVTTMLTHASLSSNLADQTCVVCVEDSMRMSVCFCCILRVSFIFFQNWRIRPTLPVTLSTGRTCSLSVICTKAESDKPAGVSKCSFVSCDRHDLAGNPPSAGICDSCLQQHINHHEGQPPKQASASTPTASYLLSIATRASGPAEQGSGEDRGLGSATIGPSEPVQRYAAAVA
jgi:hypothetical protein